MVAAISFGIGFSFFAIALAKDIKNDLRLLNICARNKEKRLQAVKQLNEFIKFHSTTKQLSNFVEGEK